MRGTVAFLGGFVALAALALDPTQGAAQAGVVVQQHITLNVAKISSSDLTQTVSILGADRAKIVTTGKTKILIISSDASGTDITRLDKDSVYRVNDKKKEYTARSLAAVRADLAKQQQDVEKQADDPKQKDDVRYSVVVDQAKATGEKQTINGFATEQVLIKLTVWAENTKTGEKSVAFHITSDSWIDKGQNEANRATMAFRMAQVKALGVEPTMAMNPYAKWLTNVDQEMARIDGYPIRSTVTCELPADTTAAAPKPADRPPPTSVGGMLGSMMSGKKKDPAPASPNGGIVVFTATNEILSIAMKSLSPAEFDVPAGYVRK